MADLPRLQITAVHKVPAQLPVSAGVTLEGQTDMQVHVVVLNPSDAVYDELSRLVDTSAVITVGGVPE